MILQKNPYTFYHFSPEENKKGTTSLTIVNYCIYLFLESLPPELKTD
jgi:hypothetical protein